MSVKFTCDGCGLEIARDVGETAIKSVWAHLAQGLHAPVYSLGPSLNGPQGQRLDACSMPCAEKLTADYRAKGKSIKTMQEILQEVKEFVPTNTEELN